MQVCDFSPQLLLKGWVWETVLADEANVTSLVARVAFESLRFERLLVIMRKVGRGVVGLENLVLVVWRKLAAELLAINNNLARVDPLGRHL